MPYDPDDPNPEELVMRWTALRMKQSHVAQYSGFTDMFISRIVNRQENLNPIEWAKLERVLENCEEVSRRMHGAVNWRNSESVTQLLKQIEHERRNPPPPPSPTDLEIYAQFAAGTDLDEIAFDFRLSNQDVLATVERVLARGATLLRTLPPADKLPVS
jgi:hypothetical protein